MSIVRLLGGEDALAGCKPAGDPEGFKVGEGAAGGEVTKEVGSRPSRTWRRLRDGFNFHLRSRRGLRRERGCWD